MDWRCRRCQAPVLRRRRDAPATRPESSRSAIVVSPTRRCWTRTEVSTRVTLAPAADGAQSRVRARCRLDAPAGVRSRSMSAFSASRMSADFSLRPVNAWALAKSSSSRATVVLIKGGLRSRGTILASFDAPGHLQRPVLVREHAIPAVSLSRRRPRLRRGQTARRPYCSQSRPAPPAGVARLIRQAPRSR